MAEMMQVRDPITKTTRLVPMPAALVTARERDAAVIAAQEAADEARQADRNVLKEIDLDDLDAGIMRAGTVAELREMVLTQGAMIRALMAHLGIETSAARIGR